jgi:hypothetical protein
MRRARNTPPPGPSTAPAGPGWKALLDPRAPVLLPLLALVVCRVFLASEIRPAGEDAYITFRYAWNWAHGLGPVFNPGEHVLGVTSPPWMAWIAIGIRLGADPVAWTRVTLGVMDAVTLVAFGALLERHASRASAWCFAVFFAVWPYFSGLLCSGLETGALIALIAAAAWLLDRRHPAVGPTLGLLAVFRPEGLLAAAVLAVWARGRDRLIAAGVLVATAAVLTLYYGSPIPQSILAKATAYGIPGPLHAPQWWEWALPVPLIFLSWTGEGSNFFPLAVIVSPAAVAGVLALRSQWRSPLFGAIAALAVIWSMLLVSGTGYFFWYMAAPLLAWVLLACVGLPRIAGHPLVYASLAVVVMGHWLYEGNLYAGRATSETGLFGHVADFLDARATPGESVLLEPIGVLGWRCRGLRLFDEVGLVTPRATACRRRGPGWYADLVADVRPDWLVVRAGLLMGNSAFSGPSAPFRDVTEGRRVLEAYQFAAPGDSTAGDQALVVFRRRPGR